VESLESDSGRPISIHVDRLQQVGVDPASWIASSECGSGEPGVYVESFAAEVPDVPEFEKSLPMLRAGGTGQTGTYMGVVEPGPYAAMTWACDGDGD
jgi:hypothetical protein